MYTGLIYDSSEGGFSYWDTHKEAKPLVPVDTTLIGIEAESWMHKVALLELGELSADEVIREVLHHYNFKAGYDAGWLESYQGRPRGKKTTLLDKIKNTMGIGE